jgi:hypothetical protein
VLSQALNQLVGRTMKHEGRVAVLAHGYYATDPRLVLEGQKDPASGRVRTVLLLQDHRDARALTALAAKSEDLKLLKKTFPGLTADKVRNEVNRAAEGTGATGSQSVKAAITSADAKSKVALEKEQVIVRELADTFAQMVGRSAQAVGPIAVLDREYSGRELLTLEGRKDPETGRITTVIVDKSGKEERVLRDLKADGGDIAWLRSRQAHITAATIVEELRNPGGRRYRDY